MKKSQLLILIQTLIDLNHEIPHLVEESKTNDLWKLTHYFKRQVIDGSPISAEGVDFIKGAYIPVLIQQNQKIQEEEKVQMGSLKNRELQRLKERIESDIDLRVSATKRIKEQLKYLGNNEESEKKKSGYKLQLSQLLKEIDNLESNIKHKEELVLSSNVSVLMRENMVAIITIIP